MKKSYIGVKYVQAEPKVRDGQHGYEVTYPDGYVSWCPKEQFELANTEVPEQTAHALAVFVRQALRFIQL